MAMSFAAGDVLEQVDLNNIILAAQGDGVRDGLAVSEDSPAGMDVDVASGHAHISNIEYTESGTVNLSIAAAHATLHRKDLVTYDPTTSNPIITQGSNHAGGDSDPIYPPDIPAGDILLAIVNVDAAVTSITNSDIDDKRIIIQADIWEIVTSDNIELDSDWTEDTTTSISYVKATNKEFTIPSSVCYSAIELYFTWQMRHSDTTGSSESRIYRNGVAVGVEKTRNTTSYATFSDTISGWSAGDLVQLYQKTSSGDTCYVDNFQVLGVYVKPW